MAVSRFGKRFLSGRSRNFPEEFEGGCSFSLKIFDHDRIPAGGVNGDVGEVGESVRVLLRITYGKVFVDI